MLCGIYVCLVQLNRYQANPSVVSVERDFYDWNGTLPSITFCYADNLSADKADEYLRATWNAEEDTEKYLYYKEFLSLLVNSNIYNFSEMLSYLDDPSLVRLDLEATIKLLISEHDHYVSSFVKDTDLTTPRAIQTERGICYTVNSVQSDIFSSSSSSPSPSQVTNKTDPILCNFVQDQCFMKLDIFGFNTSIAVHSFHELLRFETFLYQVGHDDEMATTFKLLQTINDDLVRDLKFTQRKCLFYDESHRDVMVAGGQGRSGRRAIDGTSNSVYSLNLCLLECRMESAIALCGCKPHFYPFIAHGE